MVFRFRINGAWTPDRRTDGRTADGRVQRVMWPRGGRTYMK